MRSIDECPEVVKAAGRFKSEDAAANVLKRNIRIVRAASDEDIVATLGWGARLNIATDPIDGRPSARQWTRSSQDVPVGPRRGVPVQFRMRPRCRTRIWTDFQPVSGCNRYNIGHP
jgi:hypothetical protein